MKKMKRRRVIPRQWQVVTTRNTPQPPTWATTINEYHHEHVYDKRITKTTLMV